MATRRCTFHQKRNRCCRPRPSSPVASSRSGSAPRARAHYRSARRRRQAMRAPSGSSRNQLRTPHRDARRCLACSTMDSTFGAALPARQPARLATGGFFQCFSVLPARKICNDVARTLLSDAGSRRFASPMELMAARARVVELPPFSVEEPQPPEPATRTELPPLTSAWRRTWKRPQLMHYNRIIAALLVANLLFSFSDFRRSTTTPRSTRRSSST